MKRSKFTSIGWIVFWIIIFWPVGCYFIYKRIQENKYYSLGYTATRETQGYNVNGRQGLIQNVERIAKDSSDEVTSIPGNQYRIISFLILGLGIFELIGAISHLFTQQDGEINLSGFMFVIAIPLLVWGIMRLRLYNRYKVYLNYLISGSMWSISEMSNYVGKDEYTVRSDLSEMVRHKMVSPVCLDKIAGNTSYKERISQKKGRIVKCPSCGASNEVVDGFRNVCQYCGTPLE